MEEGRVRKQKYKGLRISTDEKIAQTPKALLLHVTSGITGEKTMLENDRQTMGREKLC